MNEPVVPDLPHDFVQWWFAPWDLAATVPWADDSPESPEAHGPLEFCGTGESAVPPGLPRDLLGRRDAYRRWCAEAGIAPTLPAGADRRWTALAWLTDDELLNTARLFGGLFALRTPQPLALAGLAPDERRWCAGVANLQPLPRAPWPAAMGRDAGLAGAGLAWLAVCLEHGFPGLWPRMRLRLAAPLRAAVERCLLEGAAAPPDTALARLARCWNMCLLRVRAADS